MVSQIADTYRRDVEKALAASLANLNAIVASDPDADAGLLFAILGNALRWFTDYGKVRKKLQGKAIDGPTFALPLIRAASVKKLDPEDACYFGILTYSVRVEASTCSAVICSESCNPQARIRVDPAGVDAAAFLSPAARRAPVACV